ncbi:hypothetical protein BESB_032750 [Besnoitia besnoiti]|uniref:Uncharacterized protein n=1 Tax=Besnoitia besnoiti TaxID=94643 RepID=A0A2A9LX62_BESBE|nr:uncharacterized protein BESB_032750 [Besnoitia besnoiti]PFH31078.1 hypothetical protein BESB_032750 [Besnoitia besnoiti]
MGRLHSVIRRWSGAEEPRNCGQPTRCHAAVWEAFQAQVLRRREGENVSTMRRRLPKEEWEALQAEAAAAIARLAEKRDVEGAGVFGGDGSRAPVRAGGYRSVQVASEPREGHAELIN